MAGLAMPLNITGHSRPVVLVLDKRDCFQYCKVTVMIMIQRQNVSSETSWQNDDGPLCSETQDALMHVKLLSKMFMLRIRCCILFQCCENSDAKIVSQLFCHQLLIVFLNVKQCTKIGMQWLIF